MGEALRLALAGCGGMGRCHLRGYGVLEEAELGLLELAAVVDPSLDRATFLAGEAEQILGHRRLPLWRRRWQPPRRWRW